MDIAVYALFALLGLAAVGCLVGMWRNGRVYKFEKALIAEVSNINKAEITAGNMADWRERWAIYDSVSYEAKLFSVKRLRASNFYPNLDFLNGKDVSL